ncbi:MAG: hypothetical protein NTU44_20465 [Bacteroidetes bacterium]|nr:hypothetical protein [Bacteroidota bacterium]
MKINIITLIFLFLLLSVNQIKAQSCVNCAGTVNTGQYSTAIGYGSQSTGDYSLSLGMGNLSNGLRSIALGNYSSASGWSGLAMGNLVSAANMNSFVLGMGYSSEHPLVNALSSSLMIGFNSNLPTLFVGPSAGIGTIGKVGIGTTTPSEMLTVNGIIETKTGGIRFPDGSLQTTKAFSYWQPAANNVIYYNSGDVGIGKTDPEARLDVYGDIVLGKPGENFIIHSRPWVGDALIIAPQNGGTGWDWSKSLTLKDNGQVFIGGDLALSSPHLDYKLAVNGKVVAKEVIVTIQNWADHVLSADYPLMDLSDLERFIQKNQFLPGVPSENQVLTDGVEVGEMNKILLTKVEELTLYVINLQKEIGNIREALKISDNNLIIKPK